MKRLSVFLLWVAFAVGLTAQSLVPEKKTALKGDVKSLRETSYIIRIDEEGNESMKELLDNKLYIEYNSEGQVILETVQKDPYNYQSLSVMQYHYNANSTIQESFHIVAGDTIRYLYTWEDGLLKSISKYREGMDTDKVTDYEYSEVNRLSKVLRYDNGTKISEEFYYWNGDKDYQLVECRHSDNRHLFYNSYYEDGLLMNRTNFGSGFFEIRDYAYNDNGDVIRFQYRGNFVQQNVTEYNYEYDDRDNWVVRTSSSFETSGELAIEVVERIIEYY